MSRTISLIQQVQIASPCTAPWEQMIGDDKSRFCSQCNLNVYNLSAMTQAEGERLIIEKEGKLCARIYRRHDGTVLTKDCPVGLVALRNRIIWTGMRAAAALVFIAGAAAAAINGSQSEPKDDSFTFTGTEWVRGVDLPGPSTYGRLSNSVKRWFAPAVANPTRGWIGGSMACPLPAAPGSSDVNAVANQARQALQQELDRLVREQMKSDAARSNGR